MLTFFCSCGDDRTAAQMLQKWDVFNDSTVTSGYNGTNAFTGTVTAYTRVRDVKKVTLSPANRVIYGFRWYTGPATFPLSPFYVAYVLTALHAGSGPYSESTKQFSLNLLNDGKLEARRGGWAGTVIGTTGSAVLTDATWQYIEIDAEIGSSAAVTIRVDDLAVLYLSGVNTQALGTSAINAVEIVPWTIDDLYVCDLSTSAANPYNSFLGSRFHVRVKRPLVTNLSEWSPVTGTNLSNVNASAPDGACNRTYVAGHTDLFQPDPLEVDYPSILAVQANLTAHRASSGYSPTVASVVEIDGVRYAGAADPLANADADYRTIWAMAPDTITPWTRTVFNAAFAGYRRVG